MLRFPYAQVRLRTPAPTLGGARFRFLPMLHVNVEGPTRSIPIRFRLDSGADDTILPLSFAASLGVDLTQVPIAEAESASGAVIRYPCARVTLRISDGNEFCVWEALVGFVSTARSTGLAGLAGFLDFFDTQLFGADREFTLDPNASFSGQHQSH